MTSRRAAISGMRQAQRLVAPSVPLRKPFLIPRPISQQLRLNSSSSPSPLPPSRQEPQQPVKTTSDHSQFWRTFARPISKTLLLAVFTYQVAYFAWTWLEQNEVKTNRQAEILELESKVKSLQDAKASKG